MFLQDFMMGSCWPAASDNFYSASKVHSTVNYATADFGGQEDLCEMGPRLMLPHVEQPLWRRKDITSGSHDVTIRGLWNPNFSDVTMASGIVTLA